MTFLIEIVFNVVFELFQLIMSGEEVNQTTLVDGNYSSFLCLSVVTKIVEWG